HLLEPSPRVNLTGQRAPRLLGRAREKVDPGVATAVAVPTDVVTFKALKDMVQCLGIRSEPTLDEAELQGLPGHLEEVGQLLDLQETQPVARDPVVLQESQEEGTRPGQLRLLGADRHPLGRWSPRGLEEQNMNIRQRRQRRLDHWANIRPVQSAATAAQRGYRERADPQLFDLIDEIAEPRLDIRQPRLTLPVTLRREVDDVPRVHQARLDDEHLPGPHLASSACSLIQPEVFRVR